MKARWTFGGDDPRVKNSSLLGVGQPAGTARYNVPITFDRKNTTIKWRMYYMYIDLI